LLLVILLSGVVYISLSNKVRIRVDKEKTTFYIKQLDENGEPYGRWLVSAREYNKIFDGSSLIRRRLKDTTVETIINNETKKVTITRVTPYYNGGMVVDTYSFDGNIKDIELFPIYHTIEFFNMNTCGSKGCIFQYEVRDLDYNGTTRVASSPEVFGKRMKITFQDGYYYAKVFQQKGSDKLLVRYRIKEDYKKINVRMFDPIKGSVHLSNFSSGNLQRWLIGHWMLDSESSKGGDTTADLTPYGNDGTCIDSCSYTADRKGKENGAMKFNGESYVKIPDTDDLSFGNGTSDSPFSISVWINICEGSSNNFSIIGKGLYNEAGEWFFGLDENGKITFRLYDNSVGDCYIGKRYNTALSPYENSWIHLVGTYDGSGWSLGMDSVKIYLNGVRVDNFPVGSRPIYYEAMENLTHDVWIGRDAHYANGMMGDLRIYNRELSSEEAKILYESYNNHKLSVGSLYKGLIFDMPMKEKYMKSSTVVCDRTPYGNDGDVNGVEVGRDYTVFKEEEDSIILGEGEPTDLTGWLSLSVWISIRSFGGNEKGRIIDNGKFILMVDGRKEKVMLTSDGDRYAGSEDMVLTLKNWYHIVVVRKPNGLATFYVNGEINGEEGSSGNPVGGSTRTLIGNDEESIYNFDGYMTEMKIYNRMLSAEEIKLLYDKGR